MDTQTWLPIATLLLGWGLGLGSEWFRESRTTKREREARRKDRQYNAIVEAQDALGKLLRLKLKSSVKLAENYKETGKWELDDEDSDTDTADTVELIDTVVKVTALRSRIEDEELGPLLIDALDFILFIDE